MKLSGHSISVIPGKDRVWRRLDLAARIVEALKTAKLPIPEDLVTITKENNK